MSFYKRTRPGYYTISLKRLPSDTLGELPPLRSRWRAVRPGCLTLKQSGTAPLGSTNQYISDLADRLMQNHGNMSHAALNQKVLNVLQIEVKYKPLKELRNIRNFMKLPLRRSASEGRGFSPISPAGRAPHSSGQPVADPLNKSMAFFAPFSRRSEASCFLWEDEKQLKIDLRISGTLAHRARAQKVSRDASLVTSHVTLQLCSWSHILTRRIPRLTMINHFWVTSLWKPRDFVHQLAVLKPTPFSIRQATCCTGESHRQRWALSTNRRCARAVPRSGSGWSSSVWRKNSWKNLGKRNWPNM